MRGQAHSFFGQTQVEGGVVIDSSSLNAVRIVAKLHALFFKLYGEFFLIRRAQERNGEEA